MQINPNHDAVNVKL